MNNISIFYSGTFGVLDCSRWKECSIPAYVGWKKGIQGRSNPEKVQAPEGGRIWNILDPPFLVWRKFQYVFWNYFVTHYICINSNSNVMKKWNNCLCASNPGTDFDAIMGNMMIHNSEKFYQEDDQDDACAGEESQPMNGDSDGDSQPPPKALKKDNRKWEPAMTCTQMGLVIAKFCQAFLVITKFC